MSAQPAEAPTPAPSGPTPSAQDIINVAQMETLAKGSLGMSGKRALGLFLVGWPFGVGVFALSFWIVESFGWVALAVPAYFVVVAASAHLGMRLLDESHRHVPMPPEGWIWTGLSEQEAAQFKAAWEKAGEPHVVTPWPVPQAPPPANHSLMGPRG